MSPKYAFFYLLLVLGCSLCAAARAADTLDIEQPWIREAPPASKVLAAYMTIHNPGSQAVRINEITSPDFTSVELHRTVIEEGMARMLPLPQLEVPAKTTILLEPGGLHLMLFNPLQTLVEGDSAGLTLHLDDESCLKVTAPVMRKAGGDHTHHHH